MKVEMWKSYRLPILAVSFLIIIICGTLLSLGHYAGSFAKSFSDITTKANSKSPSGKLLSQSNASGNTNKSALLILSSMKLPKFNKSFRNPCWYDRFNNTVTLRCFPFAYIAGFPKCGTTDLYYRLVAHPLILAGIGKESHFLNKKFFLDPHSWANCSSTFHCGSVYFSDHFFKEAAERISMTNDTKYMKSAFFLKDQIRSNRPRVQFMEAFPSESMAIWKQGQKFKKYPGIIVDGTPATANVHHYFRSIAENQGYDFARNTSADWIRKFYPQAKAIMMIREPVSRALSDYKARWKRRGTASNFHNIIQMSIRELKECLEFGRPDVVCITEEYLPKAMLRASLYFYHIKSWLEKFPRKQLFIVKYEDYIANIPETLAEIYDFLGLPAVSQKGLQFIKKFQIMNVARYNFDMWPSTRALLTDFFKPFNVKLAKLLGDDRFLWSHQNATTD